MDDFLPEKCHFCPFFLPHLHHLVLDPDNNKEKTLLLTCNFQDTDFEVNPLQEFSVNLHCCGAKAGLKENPL